MFLEFLIWNEHLVDENTQIPNKTCYTHALYISSQLCNHQAQEVRCKIMYCNIFSTTKFLLLANGFCSMKKTSFYRTSVEAENVEVN